MSDPQPAFSFNPDQYQQQLASKAARLSALLTDWQAPELAVFASAAQHYRMRAEFRLWHDNDRSFYAMFNPAEPKKPLEVTQFPVASRHINQLMTAVLAAVHQDPELRQRLFQVEFLASQDGDALVTLVYHRPLTEHWAERGRYWQTRWGCSLIGRARKQRWVLGKDFIEERLNVAGRTLYFKQYENSFSQPNAGVCEQMLAWALSNTEACQQEDLLELYCGLGTFSIPLARHFKRVLATEISRTAVKAAQENSLRNGCANLSIARMASEDFSQAWLQKRESRRFKEFDIGQYRFTTLIVDPPRGGLDEHTIAILPRFQRILYISCNPISMMANIEGLRSTHRIAACALFDQFPYTDHMEAGLVLERRADPTDRHSTI